jgi:hypothetical protein
MNAKTLEAIRRHGEALLAAFPNATEKDPVALCKKLRRIETSLTKPLCDYCNGENITAEELDEVCNKAEARVVALLFRFDIAKNPHPNCACGLFVNRDPRGYALKFSEEWTSKFNQSRYAAGLSGIHRDMGGYGILAPDLTND